MNPLGSLSNIDFWYMPVHYWMPGTEYKITIKKGVKAQQNNNYNMPTDASWNFKAENFVIEEEFVDNGNFDLTMDEELFINELLKSSDLTDEIVINYTDLSSTLFDISLPVDPENPLIQQLATKMKSYVAETTGRQGLAAPQIGLNRRLFVAKIGTTSRIFINPRIDWESEQSETSVDKGKTYMGSEGCLSVSGQTYKIYRPYYINVIFDEYKNGSIEKNKSEKLTNTASGVAPLSQQPGRVWMHEFDHLNGILINDRGMK